MTKWNRAQGVFADETTKNYYRSSVPNIHTAVYDCCFRPRTIPAPASLFSNREVVYRSVEITIDYADAVGDLVVIMGSEATVIEAVPEGSPWGPGATLHRRFTNIYRKEEGNWRLIVKQSTVFSVDRP